jgi:hypothetical protein
MMSSSAAANSATTTAPQDDDADDNSETYEVCKFIPSIDIDNDSDDDDDDWNVLVASRTSPPPSHEDRKTASGGQRKRKHPPSSGPEVESEPPPPPAVSLSERESVVSKLTQSARKRERESDPGYLEEQARAIVDAADLRGQVGGITDLHQLGWEEEKGVYWPVIRVEPTVDVLLLLEATIKKKSNIKRPIYIRYLGVKHYVARKYGYISPARWVPMDDNFSAPQATDLQPSAKGRKKKQKYAPANDNDRLQTFLKYNKTRLEFKGEPVHLKAEELSIRRMWQIVQDQVKEAERQKQEQAERRSAKENSAVQVSQDDSLCSKEPKDEESDDEDEDDDKELGDSSEALNGAGDSETTPCLQVDDEIEFYAPEGVAGDPRWLCRFKILGIRPDHEYPLVLSELCGLPRTHHIRKLPDGRYRAIESYQLTEQGARNLAAGLNETVSRLKKAKEDVNKAADDFWKTGNGEPKAAAEKPKKNAGSRIRKKLVDTVNKSKAPAEEPVGRNTKGSEKKKVGRNVDEELEQPHPPKRPRRSLKRTA